MKIKRKRWIVWEHNKNNAEGREISVVFESHFKFMAKAFYKKFIDDYRYRQLPHLTIYIGTRDDYAEVIAKEEATNG